MMPGYLDQNFSKKIKGKTLVFMQVAKWLTYIIVLTLGFIHNNMNSLYIYIFVSFFFGMVLFDFLKLKYQSSRKIFVFFSYCHLLLATFLGLVSHYGLYRILYFVLLVDYLIVMEQKGVGLMVFMIYFFTGTVLYFTAQNWYNIAIDLLLLSTMMIFTLIIGHMLGVQRQEREELDKNQVQIFQREKMVSLGMLTAGVAHEINTPLGVIKSNIGMMNILISLLTENLRNNPSEDLTLDNRQWVEKLKKANETNQIACERIIDIVNKLKNFSRLDEAEWKRVNIHEGIESVLALTHHQYKYRIKIYRQYGDLPQVKCIPSQINQVIMNLVVNAIQSIEGEGEIYVTTEVDKDFAYLKIRDTGSGIAREHLGHIFDPGFTTKGVGVGTGLGLSICYNVMQKHEGDIYFRTEIGKGTEFTIKLPIGEEQQMYTQVS